MADFTPIDYKMMSRAIQLAKKGTYTTCPNPNVGCVITVGDQIVGEGFHARTGQPHAEVHALTMAGAKARGATAYVTLEPCSHYGRTPPCVEGLMKAGVANVICAMEDPNPKVAGRGIQMLRGSGINVKVGLMEAEAQAINPGFIKRMNTNMPFVQLKMAASLDGQTALGNGQSQWITSREARQDVQKFRAQSGAILTTSKTVIDDNASLNVRWYDLPLSVQQHYAESQLRQPVRVVLDRQNQLSSELNLFQTQGPILVVSEHGDVPLYLNERQQIDLRSTLSELATKHNIQHVWVESGATLASSLIRENLVDELIIYLAPKIMGSDGRGLLGALNLDSMSDVIQLDLKDVRKVGGDLRIRASILNKEL
ncbi:bifunctional diaminohydroxyphosphoribosylaminopyrimidine deaminase/5-amino-6-(5-phosphoribosylamino)uracil reductase RibD [Vibrio ostreicida]|uniref:bifunctional diaminohydroxyphosphoribosylaminopyrimidine deaminase/5-amino-6-(5-phosphoribosylamino)uracil reductase RibD n=1 Tax=Vibrio ostreicida TaxID=526588 RepID=UPI00097079EE|nr:bifunctional diaminohydroxyphosphoribosylaminopyrimidine deaminase/5-amino-6-(5-phosphoribosylamino)uracil reductase RibD [Vibrio ostreicida]